MNFFYTIIRDKDIEDRAKKEPYLFVNNSFISVNKFLSGTGIVFYDEPLEESQAFRMASIIEAYISLLRYVSTTDQLYGHCVCGISYTWQPRLHSFYIYVVEKSYDKDETPTKTVSLQIVSERVPSQICQKLNNLFCTLNARIAFFVSPQTESPLKV